MKWMPRKPYSEFLVLIALLCGAVLPVKGQTYYFDTYSAQEGASSKVYCLLQDHNRYIWFGTPAGITRFNGQDFENYTRSDGMASQAVRSIFQDRQKRIWLGHAGGGISVFITNRFQVYIQLDGQIHGDVTQIFQDYSGAYWFTTEASGAFRVVNPFTKDSLEYEQFLGEHNLSDRVYNYCLMADSSLCLITDVGIRQRYPSESSFRNFHPPGLTRYFSAITMLEDREGNLWFGTYNGGLYKYLPALDTTYAFDIRDGIASNWISDIIQSQDGALWIGTWGGGLSRVKGSEVLSFTTANGLEAQYIFSLLEDVEGSLLLGTSNNGLALFKGDIFVNYNQSDGLQNTSINAIEQISSNLYWVGTDAGLYAYRSRHHMPETARDGEKFVAVTEAGLPKGVIKFIRKSKHLTIWIGTQSEGVYFYHLRDQEWHPEPTINKWLGSMEFQITSMDVCGNNLWVGTYDGLLQYNLVSKTIIRFSNENGLVGNNITAAYCDRDDNTWVGAYVQDGISRISTTGSVLNIPSAHSITPTCMVLDNNGVLWVGTRSQGLFRNEKDSLLSQLDMERGMLSNQVNTLNVDQAGNLFIGTHKGLNVYDMRRRRIVSYTSRNGFVGVEANPQASCFGSDGLIWFGTNQGINRFNPSDLERIREEAHIFLKAFRVNNELREFTPNMRLRHRDNHISFSYESICLTNPDAVRYRYMLEGVDDNWQAVTTQNQISYQTLPPGRYSFQVIASNSSGIWNKNPVSYNFQILTPLYQRWYFILALVLFLGLAIRVYVKLRERQLVHEKTILEDKVQARTLQLSEANNQLERKNKDITDSIQYAQRIQMAILPSRIPFADTFIFFAPKDIVSGDFYWVAKVGNKELMAAVDCTGHGVPGAFISFVGYSSLNKVVKEKGFTQPSDVLDKINESIVQSLNLQSEDAINDGMDLALVCYDVQAQVLEYAGAYNPLYLIRKGKLLETKADRFAIGKSHRAARKFTNHKLEIKSGDTVYIFSDGFADQFGGEENKKFKTANLKKLLVGIQDKTMAEQQQILEKAFTDWKGENEQIDDVLIMGRKL